MIKRILLFLCISMLAILLVACENGVNFGPSDNTVIEDETDAGSDQTITDGDDDEDGSKEEENLEDVVHTGTERFTYNFTKSASSNPSNMKFSGPSSGYIQLADTTGYGFNAKFDFKLNIPNIENVDTGVTATIENYLVTQGDEDALGVTFEDGSKKFTFTHESSSTTLHMNAVEKRLLQEGEFVISFSYNPEVYSDEVPTKIYVLFNSTGNSEKKYVAINSVVKTNDKAYSEIYEGLEANSWNVEITDSESENPSQWYDLPLTINLYNVEKGAPLKLSASSNSGIELRDYSITEPNDEGQASISLTIRANKFGIAEAVTSNAVLTLTSDYTDIYAGLPMDLTINTQRKEFFEFYASDYVNKFSVTSSGSAKDENGKYYTAIRLPGASALEIERDKTINYVIRRIDDATGEKKEIRTGTFKSHEGFSYWDRDALILTKNPMYELEISTANVSVVSSSMKEGTRNLTNYELGLVAINTIRYALIDMDGQKISGSLVADQTKQHTNNTFKHWRDYSFVALQGPHFHHYYSLINYKPFFMNMLGTTDKNNVAVHYKSHTDGSLHSADNANSIKSNRVNFKGITNFNSSYGSGYILLNDIHIKDDTWSNPGWTSGTIQVSADGKVVNYDYNDGLPFGFYMTKTEFINKVAPGETYTQR